MPMQMDHDQPLEDLLRSARLLAPSDRLDARLDAVFASSRISRRLSMRLWPLAIAAAVAIVAAPAIWFIHASGHQPSASRVPAASHPIDLAAAEPMRIERDVSQVFDEGIVAVSDNQPYQQIRRHTLHEILYIDPQTHARLMVRMPTEQIVVEKVEAF